MAHLSLRLFGALQILLDQRPITNIESDKARALLIYLALEAGRPQGRALLAGLLWPELEERAARHNLSQALFNLRRALGDQAASTPFLLSTRDSVQFNVASDHELDARSFELLLAACATHSHRRIDHCAGCAQRLERAVELYQGDFLAQFMLDDATPFEDWLRPQRERFRQSAIDAHVTLAAFSEGRGDYAAAANRIQQLLELDPWNEAAYRSLMRVLGLDGQRSAALAVYRRCCDTLKAELGVEPESETQALYESLRASSGPASITTTIPTPKSAPTQSLPAALTPFVGREQELHAIGDLLSDRRCRLVTLHGPGGVGKTRLALQAALENAEMYADGVWFVSLAHLLAPALLVPTIADALNVPLRGSGPPLTQLQQAVQSKNSLLVLDNFEQLVEEAPILSELLRAAPNLSMIVTSRERLALQSEWVIEISGLTVPIAGRDDDIAQSSAGQLWIQTAQRARHGYALSESDYAAVGQICRLVEGMPLAIELAAAWVSERSPATIAAEVAQQATRLTTPWRDVHERHRSFDAVLAHSWSMLGHAEQRVLSRLSVFRGGAAHSAAIRVANASDEHLVALVKKSLLRLISTSTEDQRYELHEITRQYAAEQLAVAGESQHAAEQHLAYVVALTAEANRFWGGAEETAWVARLETEHANIRSALEWALTGERVREALLVCCAIWRFWQARSHIDEGRRWLKRVLREAETGLVQTNSPESHLRERALAYKGAGVLAWEHSDYPDAAACFEQSFALYEALDDHEGLAALSNNLGVLYLYQGKYEQAEPYFERSLAFRREQQDLWGISTCLNNLGALAGKQGDNPRAQRYYEEALVICRQIGHDRSIAVLLTNLGDLIEEQGQIEHARRLWTESLALYRTLNHPSGMAKVLTRLGAAAANRNDLAQAALYYTESLTLLQSIGEKEYIAVCLEGFGTLALAHGHSTRAVQLWGAAEAVREAINVPLAPYLQPRHQQRLSSARKHFDYDTFERAWAYGRDLSLDQAITLALSQPES